MNMPSLPFAALVLCAIGLSPIRANAQACGPSATATGFAAGPWADAPPSCPPMVMDVDGNVYNTVEIGGQCWMAENLATETYRDGSPATAWSYGGNPANKATYGLMYNWYTATDSRGLCPAGWHVPTDGEWTELTDHLGGASVAGGPMKTTGTLGAGTGLWLAPNTGATNSSGFSGLPGGLRSNVGFYNGLGYDGRWWSASESSTDLAWRWTLYRDAGNVTRGVNDKVFGFSVRCVRDE